MLYYLHISLIYNNQNLKRTQMSFNREMATKKKKKKKRKRKTPKQNNNNNNKMWCIYTMECYSAIKNNDFMKFLAKWMEPENIILSEVTQSQWNTYDMYSLVSGY
jgi:TPP-dependent 2-oxoacid decarboxylase